ncbi:MAG: FIST C-terminal domain-containing protein [Bacteroidota bacterium]
MFISEKVSIDDLIQSFDQEKVNWLMIAEHSNISITELIDQSNKRGYTIAGGIFPMVIYDQQSYEKGIVLKTIQTTQAPILVPDIGSVSREDLPIIDEKDRSCIIFLDGLSDTIPSFLDHIYEKYGNTISYVGAGAGSLTLQQSPCIFTNEGLFENAAVLLMASNEVSLGVKHGWEKISGPYVANKTDGNRIVELNWRPAFDVYKEVVEASCQKKFKEDNFFDIAKGFPFGIYREGQEDIVRDPISVDESGALMCVGQVSQNTSLNILKGDKDNLVSCAKEAANQSLNDGKSDVFVVDCISRILYLEEGFKEELDVINSVVREKDDRMELEGILSLGEISSGQDGFLELYNKTIVVSSFR